MYKINRTDRFANSDNNSNNNSNRNNYNKKDDDKYGKYGSKYDLIHQDIQKMHLLPPHCPMYPVGYNAFFNDSNKLAPVSPYKMKEVKHSKDGKIYRKLEYNNFYSDWKQDSLKWYPNTSYNGSNRSNGSNGGNRSNTEYDSIPQEYSRLNVPNTYNNESIKLYYETKRNDAFANPLATNGTNQLNIIFNDKCNKTTFNYKRYAAQNMNNVGRYENPLYDEDITNETQGLKSQYMKDIVQNSMDLYSSVAEDMYALSYEPSIAINAGKSKSDNSADTYDIDMAVNSNLYSNAINSIRRSY